MEADPLSSGRSIRPAGERFDPSFQRCGGSPGADLNLRRVPCGRSLRYERASNDTGKSEPFPGRLPPVPSRMELPSIVNKAQQRGHARPDSFLIEDSSHVFFRRTHFERETYGVRLGWWRDRHGNARRSSERRVFRQRCLVHRKLVFALPKVVEVQVAVKKKLGYRSVPVMRTTILSSSHTRLAADPAFNPGQPHDVQIGTRRAIGARATHAFGLLSRIDLEVATRRAARRLGCTPSGTSENRNRPCVSLVAARLLSSLTGYAFSRPAVSGKALGYHSLYWSLLMPHL